MLAHRLQRLSNINAFSARTDFRRQIQTYKVDPPTEKVKYL